MLPRSFSVDVPDRFPDHLVDQLDGKAEAHFALLDPCDRQEVFHQASEPLRVVVDIGKGLYPRLLIQFVVVRQQIARVARNGGQRRAEVVGDGAQHVGPHLLVSGHYGSALFLLCVAAVVYRQRAFAENGKQHAVFKGIQRSGADPDADDAVNLFVDPDREIQALRIPEAVRSGARAASVGERPPRHALFFLAQKIPVVLVRSRLKKKTL